MPCSVPLIREEPAAPPDLAPHLRVVRPGGHRPRQVGALPLQLPGACKRPHGRLVLPPWGGAYGAEGGIRTHTPLRAADFESAASTIPPLRRCVPCKKEEWSGRGDSNPRPSPWQGDALPLSHFRSDGGMSLHPYSTKNQAAVNPSASLAPHHPQPRHPRTHPPPPPNPPPQSRRASDRQRPCHPPLALAPRRLYTSPMRNPTSACPHLPDAARGTSPRSTNCPESGPPYPQNGSCWTGRIVSAADGFEADSFPKKENLGGGTNRRSSPRPQGLSPRRETFAQPPFPHLHPHRHSRESGNPGWTWLGGAPSLTPCATATPQPSPHMAVAPATRRAATRVKPRRRCQGGVSRQRTINAQNHAEATGSLHQANDQPFVYLPGSEGAKKRADYPPNYNNQTARCRQRPPAPPSDRCDAVALRCATMPQATPTRHRQPLEHYGDPCTTVIPAPTHRHPSTLPCMAVAPATGNPGRRGSAGHPPHPLPPQSRRAATASDRECDVMGPTR